jgi:hypothetical protein
VVYGVAAACLAVAVQLFFGVTPPPAYGICVACHTRDMFNWVADHLFSLHWPLATVSVAAPMLTTIGILAGAWIAAARHGEARPVSLGRGLLSFVCGILVMNGAIAAFGCPTRLLLLSAYGDQVAAVGVGGVIVGIVAGTMLLKHGAVQ